MCIFSRKAVRDLTLETAIHDLDRYYKDITDPDRVEKMAWVRKCTAAILSTNGKAAAVSWLTKSEDWKPALLVKRNPVISGAAGTSRKTQQPP